MTSDIEEEIEQTRAQLGETVARLAAKADVKARGRGMADKLTDRMRAAADQVRQQAAEHRRLTSRPVQVAAVAAILAALLVARRMLR